MKRIVISLVFALLFVCAANAQTKSVVGTVVDYTVGNSGKWAGIDLKVGNKKYFVYTESVNLPTPKIVGNVTEIGRTVQVFYTKIDTGESGYDGELRATKIVEVKTAVRSITPRGASTSSTQNLVGALRNINADGPGCYFRFADGRLMFFDSWSGDTWINIDGSNVALHLVKETNPKGRVRVGSQATKLYSAGDITVSIVEVRTRSGWSATFTVRKGNRTQVVRATGVCGD